jgi:hypothetical protein
MRKNIDLSDEAVKALAIQAIENGTNFKNYVEAKLEEIAKTKLPQRAKYGGGVDVTAQGLVYHLGGHMKGVHTYTDLIELVRLIESCDSDTVSQLSAWRFVEWVVELLPQEYDMDVRRRFTPQVQSPNENELLWIETHKYNRSNPKFYTTQEVYKMWLTNCPHGIEPPHKTK